MLYPKLTQSRNVLSLDGSWDFAKGDADFNEEMMTGELTDTRPIPVPSSYNDIYKDLRTHFGWVYYQTKFYFSKLEDKRVVLRFDGVNQSAKVYLNGKFICEHEGGYLPFEADVSEILEDFNILTVAVSNIINNSTLPVGIIKDPDVKQVKNEPNFDFFNYAGIQRHVRMYTTPKKYIEDITLNPLVKDNSAEVKYLVETSENSSDVKVKIYDASGKLIDESEANVGSLRVDNPRLWDMNDPYLYKVEVQFKDDRYYLDCGIRTVEVKGKKFLLNGKPVYFKGFGKHEDSNINGRGFNEVLNHKDFALMKEMGANSFRTSHYPYAEETMILADKLGFLVIDETTAVGLNGKFGGGANFHSEDVNIYDGKDGMANKVFDHHKEVLTDLIKRDKNYACVVMWSIANEPDSYSEGAYDYFKPLFDLAKELDVQKRPATLVSVLAGDINKDCTRRLSDVICINRYYGWYNDGPDLELSKENFSKELDNWDELGKPVIITEYGADTLLGMRDDDDYPSMFSEEYQVDYYKANNDVIDKYECVIGEHPWNFADFNTAQSIKRVNGNKKGLFTRDRMPKLVVNYIKKRWNSMENFVDKNK